MKRRLTELYNTSSHDNLTTTCRRLLFPENLTTLDGIEVELKVSIIKTLHVGLIKDLYDHLISEEGGNIISNGQKAAFITKAIEKSSKSLDLVDLFHEVDPLTNEVNEILEVMPTNQDDIGSFATQSTDGYEE